MTAPLTVRLGEIVRDTITQNRAILLGALESLAAETRTMAEDGLDGMDADQRQYLVGYLDALGHAADIVRGGKST